MRGFRNNNDTDMFKYCSKACRHGSRKPLEAVTTIMGIIATEFIKTAELLQQNYYWKIIALF